MYGGGFRFRYDSRDNVLSSSSGFYADWSYNAYNFLGNRAFKFSNYTLDLRKFITVNKKRNHVWAMQGLIQLTDGQAPFRYLPGISTRAYNPNLYRDRNLYLVRNEYRFRLYKFIGMSLFGGLGLVSRDVENIELSRTKWNMGGGFRFLVSKKYNVNMRLEYGLGDKSSTYYLSFTDTF